MNKINLNELRDCAYRIAREHGFHDKEFITVHYLMLVITELSEAVEADRKGKKALVLKFQKEYERYKKLVEEPIRFKGAFEKYIKDSVEDELADAVIRLLDLAGLRGVDLSEVEENLNDIYINISEMGEMLFTEFIFSVIIQIVEILEVDIQDGIGATIFMCFTIAHAYGIDLLWHIEQKMKYNELRPKLHEKKY